MKNKGFTLVELVIVIAVLSIIMLIGVPAFAQIVERMKVRSDKASANEIGKALTVRESMVSEDKKIPYYPVITRYDQLDNIGTYIASTHKPQSMIDGYYFATALNVNNAKKILVGIGKKEMPVTNTVYNNPRNSGWVYIESGKIDDFLATNSTLLNETVLMPDNYQSKETIVGEENTQEVSLAVGQYVQYTPPAGSCSVTVNGTTSSFSKTNDWQIFSVSGDTIALISAESVGNLTLGGKEGYTDAVRILNDISNEYVDNNLVSSGRGLGSTPGVSVETVTSPITFSDSVVASPYEDNTHNSDVFVIANNEDLQVANDIWLASRYIVKSDESTYFAVRYLPSSNRSSGYSLYIAKSDKTSQSLGEKPFGVRPIVYVARGVKLGNGDGTKYKPYKLIKEN